ncbi:hypothetical protein HCH_01140 [Hahella chejuensis KCTC 2396]|uniref:Uncharacterized protein n=1 Tax=Hahella chejuensis (strain KCTC 2396) TaxID=349521 RepID=Q2SMV7_HAHCH|nr:hypothetical protein [Hahella chejuensis]ABC28017.1 hypothetical protein HCH_01140 [Hahella chejuensis KCTC 2396]
MHRRPCVGRRRFADNDAQPHRLFSPVAQFTDVTGKGLSPQPILRIFCEVKNTLFVETIEQMPGRIELIAANSNTTC